MVGVTGLADRHPQANGLAAGACFDVLNVDGPVGAHAIQELAATRGLQSSGSLVRTGGWLALRAHGP